MNYGRFIFRQHLICLFVIHKKHLEDTIVIKLSSYKLHISSLLFCKQKINLNIENPRFKLCSKVEIVLEER